MSNGNYWRISAARQDEMDYISECDKDEEKNWKVRLRLKLRCSYDGIVVTESCA